MDELGGLHAAYERGRALFDQQLFDAARDVFSRLVHNARGLARDVELASIFGLAETERATGRHAAAAELYREVIERAMAESLPEGPFARAIAGATAFSYVALHRIFRRSLLVPTTELEDLSDEGRARAPAPEWIGPSDLWWAPDELLLGRTSLEPSMVVQRWMHLVTRLEEVSGQLPVDVSVAHRFAAESAVDAGNPPPPARALPDSLIAASWCRWMDALTTAQWAMRVGDRSMLRRASSLLQGEPPDHDLDLVREMVQASLGAPGGELEGRFLGRLENVLFSDGDPLRNLSTAFWTLGWWTGSRWRTGGVSRAAALLAAGFSRHPKVLDVLTSRGLDRGALRRLRQGLQEPQMKETVMQQVLFRFTRSVRP